MIHPRGSLVQVLPWIALLSQPGVKTLRARGTMTGDLDAWPHLRHVMCGMLALLLKLLPPFCWRLAVDGIRRQLLGAVASAVSCGSRHIHVVLTMDAARQS